MSENTVQWEIDGPVAVVTLSRPEVFNALNSRLLEELLATVRSVSDEPAVRVVVLRGAGPGFCAGADLGQEIGDTVTEELENEYKPIFLAIAQSPKIWIASVHGSAAGIGGALAMNCDLVVMAESANIYLAFAAIGLIPDGGANWLLVHAMGYRRALQTVLEGRKIPAAECLALGLANKISGDDGVHETSIAWARQLAQGAPLAQATAKRVLRKMSEMSYAEAFSLEAVEQHALTQSEDFQAGVAAFFAKRKPVFKGQ